MPRKRLVITTRSPLETKTLGRMLGEVLSGGETILLEGPLGAGKTVLVQGIAKGVGYEGPVQSPSFVLERVHKGRLILRHLDLYRLTGEEAMEAGLLEEPDPSTVLVIEWARRAEGLLLWTMRIEIEFLASSPEERRIVIEPAGLKWGEKAKHVLEKFRGELAQSTGP
ncbi:MAG TPA: tRNA (adenosine(37)-N6)-threonylcarbamoyltransferase complex ATPase subunit type 1 TsaE [Firmicutes bacterium]|nr:tRNA (adenosine(37)-N6)-threonylcarbamoyltransferase complex ATPase subunit type 1 TsaE [Candidatus Fermentithermobacillaceae bacterium]